ncbi:hypothetical protein ACC695_38685, partial [Rhizobium ruizarguesonis]
HHGIVHLGLQPVDLVPDFDQTLFGFGFVDAEVFQDAHHVGALRLVSAVSGEGVDTLMEEISRRLSGVMTVATIRLPVDKLALLPWLYDHAI